MENWKRIPILLNLQSLENAATSNNLTSLIMKNLVEYGGLTKMEIENKLVCFIIDGVNGFQGIKFGVTT
jgi:hypothetical protein